MRAVRLAVLDPRNRWFMGVPTMKTVKMLLAPLSVAIVLAFAGNASAFVTPWERAVVRHDARDLRADILRAGPVYRPVERAVIRHEAWDVRRDIRRAVWH